MIINEDLVHVMHMAVQGSSYHAHGRHVRYGVACCHNGVVTRGKRRLCRLCGTFIRFGVLHDCWCAQAPEGIYLLKPQSLTGIAGSEIGLLARLQQKCIAHFSLFIPAPVPDNKGRGK